MTLTQITEKGIKDGEIVNADINASAAIAGTKISSDFGSQNVTTTGNLGGKNLNLVHTAPTISLTDSNADDDFDITVDGGLFKINDATNTANRLEIGSDGRFRVGCTAQPSATVGGFQLDMGSYPGTLRLMSGAGASGTDSASLAIGGSNHHANLHNGANSGGKLDLYNYNTTDGNSTAVSFHNSNGLGIGRILGHNESHSNRLGNLVFMTSDGSFPVEAMRLTHDGKLGIGTTNPSSKIDIHCGADNTGLQITSTDAGAFASYFDNTGASTIGHQGTDLVLSCDPAGSVGSSNIVFQVDSNNERMIINSSGSVGIGTSSPQRLLHQHLSSSSANYHQFTNSTTGSGGGNGSITGIDANEDLVLWNQENKKIRLGTNNTERVVVDSSGKVSVKTNGLNLENATATSSRAFSITNAGGTTGWTFGNGVVSSAHQFVIYDNSAGAGRMLIDSNGIARFNNGIQLGNGLTSSSAHRLDDYEEGTWTPSAVQGVSSVSFITARYTKIGRQVFLTARFTPSGSSNGSSLNIGGLPFQSGSQNQNSFSIMHNGLDEGGSPEPVPHGHISANTSTMSFYYSRTAGVNWAAITGSEAVNHEFIFATHYYTDL